MFRSGLFLVSEQKQEDRYRHQEHQQQHGLCDSSELYNQVQVDLYQRMNRSKHSVRIQQKSKQWHDFWQLVSHVWPLHTLFLPNAGWDWGFILLFLFIFIILFPVGLLISHFLTTVRQSKSDSKMG